jgi:hypothetical protein
MNTILPRQMDGWRSAGAAEPRPTTPRAVDMFPTNGRSTARASGWTHKHERVASNPRGTFVRDSPRIPSHRDRQGIDRSVRAPDVTMALRRPRLCRVTPWQEQLISISGIRRTSVTSGLPGPRSVRRGDPLLPARTSAGGPVNRLGPMVRAGLARRPNLGTAGRARLTA